MEKKTKIILTTVIVVAIVVIGIVLFFVMFKDEKSKFLGKWKAESGMGMPAGADAYFTFYENGSIENRLVYSNGETNITWYTFWLQSGLIYVNDTHQSITPGYSYEFSNDNTHLKLTLGGYTVAVFNKS